MVIISGLTNHFYCIIAALNHYNGLMQDMYFYTQALTARYSISEITQKNIYSFFFCFNFYNREVEELATGNFPYNSLQGECRCPPSHPVINSVSPGLCIQHSGRYCNNQAK